MPIRILRAAGVSLLLIGGALWLYTWMQVRAAAVSHGPLGRFAAIESIRLHYVGDGQGPAVVLLHGNPGSVRDFDRLIPELASDHRVVALDRPGHGHSDRPHAATPRRQAALLRATLSQFGIGRPVLLGHSWGGALALVFALEYPDEVAGLVLAGPRTQVQPGAEDWLYRIVRTPVLGRVLEWTVLLPAGRPLVERGLAAAYAPEPMPPSELGAARSLWLRPGQMDATVWDTANLQEALATHAPRYPELRVPIAIVTGEYDDLLSESKALHESVPAAWLTVVPDAGHMIIKTRPRVVAAAVRAVTSALRSTSSPSAFGTQENPDLLRTEMMAGPKDM